MKEQAEPEISVTDVLCDPEVKNLFAQLSPEEQQALVGDVIRDLLASSEEDKVAENNLGKKYTRHARKPQSTFIE